LLLLAEDEDEEKEIGFVKEKEGSKGVAVERI
jgi:hypothetical protein